MELWQPCHGAFLFSSAHETSHCHLSGRELGQVEMGPSVAWFQNSLCCRLVLANQEIYNHHDELSIEPIILFSISSQTYILQNKDKRHRYNYISVLFLRHTTKPTCAEQTIRLQNWSTSAAAQTTGNVFVTPSSTPSILIHLLTIHSVAATQAGSPSLSTHLARAAIDRAVTSASTQCPADARLKRTRYAIGYLTRNNMFLTTTRFLRDRQDC